MKVLTLCGSLRAQSANRTVLRAFARLAPPTMVVDHYERLAALPPFNPDLDGETVPPEVAGLRQAVAAADAVVISTPEYAHGLPGAFKNSLDWLVSDPAFAGKPIAVLHIDRGSTWALDSLREILRTMSARLLAPACVALPLTSNRIDEATLLAREDLRTLLEHSVRGLSAAPIDE